MFYSIICDLTRFSRKIITDMFVKGFSGMNTPWFDEIFKKFFGFEVFANVVSVVAKYEEILLTNISNLLYYFLLILHFLFQTMSLVWSTTPQFWKSLLFTVPLRNPSESQSSRISKPIRKSTQFSSRKSPIPRSICQKPTFWFRFQVMVVHVGKKPSVWVEF